MTDDMQSAPHQAAAATSPKPPEPTMNMRTVVYYAAKTVVYGFAGMALSISLTHVSQLATRTGVQGWHSYVAPAFVDGLMLLGRLGQSKYFEEETRRVGRWTFAIGVVLSLVANILSGETLGERVFGAMVVLGFAFGEWYAGKLKPAPAPAPVVTPEEQAAAELSAKRSAAALKGLETKRLKAAAQAAAPAKTRTRKTTAAPAKTRTRKTTPVAGMAELAAELDQFTAELYAGIDVDDELAAMVNGATEADAPVSPATVPTI